MADKRPVKIGAPEDEHQLYQDLAQEFGTPLLVYDESVVEQHYRALCDALPAVRMYYAVKALPQEQVIRTIDSLGGGFDVASGGETDLLLKLKVFGRRTIHTHPVKKDEEIRTALRYGVTTFVIDNVYELEKFVSYRSRVGLILRVSFRSPGAIVDLSRKFGCNLSEVPSIVARAGELGIHIKGLSFHVGSQCADASKHVESIEKCSELMLQLNAENDRLMNVLDIGGGFPADYDRRGVVIDTFCAPIREALGKLPAEWDIIAEPGRYLVAAAVTSITSVVGRSVRDGVNWYYLDDGAYGSYSGQIYDHACYPLQVLKEGPLHRSILAGPTCDSIDVVAEDILLPELTAGDLVIGHEMGAYTAATRTRFNSLPDARFLDLASRRIVD
ncbi:MAG: type III PLP-dependent enzyme [Aquisalinus sp.]|nr:type III PLP-dependent enzyme [Aquisalinus sp.]